MWCCHLSNVKSYQNVNKMLSIKEPDIKVLNKGDNLSKCLKTAVDMSKDLQKLMLRMKSDYMTDDGKGVDYKSLKESSLLPEYTTLAVNLQSVQLDNLTEKEKMAFFINVYNALTIHGLATCSQLPHSVLDIQQFWKVTAYVIGGYVFSLDDIEHGILRGNRPHPSAKDHHFKPSDPRVKFTVKERDPRIHFALVCGAKSCPAIQVYTAENVDKALDAATRSFCEQEVVVYEIQKQIRVSQIFQWYCVDFGENDVEAVRWTLPYLSEIKRKSLKNLLYKLIHEGMVDLIYTEYNWSLNIKEEKLEMDDFMEDPVPPVHPGSGTERKDHKRPGSSGKSKT